MVGFEGQEAITIRFRTSKENPERPFQNSQRSILSGVGDLSHQILCINEKADVSLACAAQRYF